MHVASVKVLALGGAELPLHLKHLDVACAHVVEDAEAKDMTAGVFLLDVHATLAKEHAELQLEIEHLAVQRPAHIMASADHAEAIALVIDWLVVPDLRDLHLGRVSALTAGEEIAVGARLAQMHLEAQEVAHLARFRHRREQLHRR